MIINSIGVPKEIKDSEKRVGLRPQDVKLLKFTDPKIQIFIENNAGINCNFTNQDYQEVGGIIVNKRDLFKKSTLIVKVKEPQEIEFNFIKNHHILFCYMHYAAAPRLKEYINNNKIKTIPFESVKDKNGNLPLLFPMSEIAGKLAAHKAAELLIGNGKLIGGATGVEKSNILIIGGGVVGENAATVSLGMGANVVILDKNVNRLKYLDSTYPKLKTLMFSENNLINYLQKSNVVIGAVHNCGMKTDSIIKNKHAVYFEDNSIFIDVAIDQGGCAEFSKPTTHSQPTYKYKHITCYCVSNMPGITPITSTNALCNSVVPYLVDILKTNKSSRDIDDVMYIA